MGTEEEVGTELVDKYVQNLGKEPVEPEETPTETPVEDDPKVDKPDEEVVETGQVPVGVVKELREKNRNLHALNEQFGMKTAELEGRLAQLTEIVSTQRANVEQKEVELSPLELLAEDNPEAIADAATLLAERDWQNKRAKASSVSQQQDSESQKMKLIVQQARVVMSDEQMGVGLGLDSVIGLAKQSNLLSDQDHAFAMQYGDKSPQKLYEIAIEKIKVAGGIPLQELTRRISAIKPINTGPKNVNNETPTEEPVEDKEHQSSIMKFMFSEK